MAAGTTGPGGGGDQADGDQALEAAFELAQLLDTGLDKELLSLLIGLLENGVNPEALAAIVKELRREAAELRARHLHRGVLHRVVTSSDEVYSAVKTMIIIIIIWEAMSDVSSI